MKRLLLFLALTFATTAPALAQEDMSFKVKARLVAEGGVAPASSVAIALEQNIRPGWHTYWRNPGQVGLSTSIDWTLPPGWKAGPIQWPVPKRLPTGPFMDYGYEGKVWLLSSISAPTNVKSGEMVTLKGHASWLVCEKVCVPEDMTLSVPVTVGKGIDAAVATDFARARALLPVISPWKSVFARGASLDLYLAAPALVSAHPARVEFFPLKSGAIKDMAEQSIAYNNGGLVLRMTPGDKPADPLDGVLVLTSADKSVQAIEVSAPQGTVPAADFGGTSSAGSDISLWLALLSAFVGGLILNVMPCVLPILAMKALALARHYNAGAVAESLAYAGGAVLSFAGLGLALIALRAGGTAVGWGFQLQSPIAVAGFSLLVFAVGLNLSGLFEIGSITAGESLTHKSGVSGAFFTGVLAVAVAAPCTAPFMAPALGFAITQGAATALAIFIALGLGFAFPFLLLGLWPRALRFVPKPGPWMLRFKQFLAFPMYGAAAWLAWVLAVQAGANSLIFLFAAMVILALGLWLWSVTRDLPGRGRRIGLMAAILLLLGAVAAVAQLGSSANEAASATALLTNSESYSAERLDQLRSANRPVLIDATAAWCITCLVNEETTLSRAPVQAALKSRNVALLVADWTNRNAAIAALLTDNGRSGVPLYLYYAPGAAKPKVLPQVLTQNIVTDAIAN